MNNLCGSHLQSYIWRWLPHRLSKRQSLSTTTVLFRTTFTRTIKLNLLLKWPFTVLQHVTFNNVASVCTGLNFFIFAHDNWLPSLAGMCKLLKTFLLQNEVLRSLTGNNHTLNPKQNLLLTRTVITLQFSGKRGFDVMLWEQHASFAFTRLLPVGRDYLNSVFVSLSSKNFSANWVRTFVWKQSQTCPKATPPGVATFFSCIAIAPVRRMTAQFNESYS